MNKETPDDDYERALQGWMEKSKPADADGDEALFGREARFSEEQQQALGRVREWVRERFKLADDAAILVSEIVCTLPGCPPLETAVAFWEGQKRHHFKLFKPVMEVSADDLPFAWMKAELIVPEGFNCDCC